MLKFSFSEQHQAKVDIIAMRRHWQASLASQLTSILPVDLTSESSKLSSEKVGSLFCQLKNMVFPYTKRALVMLCAFPLWLVTSGSSIHVCL